MKIIGHRGAAGIALENSLEAIRAGIAAGVDAVEIDIRMTADGEFVLSHDPTTARTSPSLVKINDRTLQQLERVTLNNLEPIPSLADALRTSGRTQVVIEAKGNNWAAKLAAVVATRSVDTTAVISFNHQELQIFHSKLPNIPVYPISRTKAHETLKFAKQHNMAGVDFKFWLLNPYTYWYARRFGLEIIVYTVNQRWLQYFIYLLYPRVNITTDVPQRIKRISR
ncbi:MAG: glycerophosphodiester phosphodiesterase family protein [Candidatus Saccharimonadales bacterium]